MMKLLGLQGRFFFAKLIVLVLYLFIFKYNLERYFHIHAYVYATCFSVVFLSTPLFFMRRNISAYIFWLAIIPIVASTFGYFGLSLMFFVEHGFFVKVSFFEWFFSATIAVYFAAGVWFTSVLLMAAYIIDHYVFGDKLLKL